MTPFGNTAVPEINPDGVVAARVAEAYRVDVAEGLVRTLLSLATDVARAGVPGSDPASLALLVVVFAAAGATWMSESVSASVAAACRSIPEHRRRGATPVALVEAACVPLVGPIGLFVIRR